MSLGFPPPFPKFPNYEPALKTPFAPMAIPNLMVQLAQYDIRSALWSAIVRTQVETVKRALDILA